MSEQYHLTVVTPSVYDAVETLKHISKLYSSMNNMDPGPVPPELQVGVS